MKAFLITYKPNTENPELGWPLEELRKLINSNRAGDKPIEEWRFNNLKDVVIGDRAFLLLQGKKGPAIIGYGKIVGPPQLTSGRRYVPVQFDSIVDPTVEVLAGREDLLAITDGANFWRAQSSGVLLPKSVADDLESLVVGKSPRPSDEEANSNTEWTRDERIIALDFYLRHRIAPPAKDTPQIVELAETIKRLALKLRPQSEVSPNFRSQNSVYMKLMNFRSLDPLYLAEGKAGLARSAKEDKEVWETFSQDQPACHALAKAILAGLESPESASTFADSETDDIQEAPEGRLLTRIHLARERNRQLVDAKRKQAMTKFGKLNCEACGFDFLATYGQRGKGFIECHHIKPLATLTEGSKTHLNDLALVCANCHRIIHRGKPWISLSELKALIHSNTPTHSN